MSAERDTVEVPRGLLERLVSHLEDQGFLIAVDEMIDEIQAILAQPQGPDLADRVRALEDGIRAHRYDKGTNADEDDEALWSLLTPQETESER